MGSPLIPGIVPRRPPAQSMHSARPTRGRVVAALDDGIAALLGCHLLRTTTSNYELGQQSDDTVTAGGLIQTWPLRVPLSPYGSHLHVGIWYHAVESVSSVAQLSITAEDPAGAVIDAAMTYSEAAGTLRTTDPGFVFSLVGGVLTPGPWGAVARREHYLSTPWILDAAPGKPRLLDVSGHEGRDVVVMVRTSGVRIYRISAAEVYRERVG